VADTVKASIKRRLEGAWIVANLAYSAFRIFLAHTFLVRRGLNIWAYAAVEYSSTLPWSIGSARLTMALARRDLRRAWRWGLLASAGFFAPDTFVISTTHHVPWYIYVAIATWVSIASVLATRRVALAVRARRVVDEGPRTPAASSPSPH
jgi:hypothetical protein